MMSSLITWMIQINIVLAAKNKVEMKSPEEKHKESPGTCTQIRVNLEVFRRAAHGGDFHLKKLSCAT